MACPECCAMPSNRTTVLPTRPSRTHLRLRLPTNVNLRLPLKLRLPILRLPYLRLQTVPNLRLQTYPNLRFLIPICQHTCHDCLSYSLAYRSTDSQTQFARAHVISMHIQFITIRTSYIGGRSLRGARGRRYCRYLCIIFMYCSA